MMVNPAPHTKFRIVPSLFFGLDHARQIITMWVHDYNTARPHFSLGYQTPAAYAASLTATGVRLRNPDQLRRSPVAHTAPQAHHDQRRHHWCDGDQ